MIKKLKPILPNRPYGKTHKENVNARLVDINNLVDQINEAFPTICEQIVVTRDQIMSLNDTLENDGPITTYVPRGIQLIDRPKQTKLDQGIVRFYIPRHVVVGYQATKTEYILPDVPPSDFNPQGIDGKFFVFLGEIQNGRAQNYGYDYVVPTLNHSPFEGAVNSRVYQYEGSVLTPEGGFLPGGEPFTLSPSGFIFGCTVTPSETNGYITEDGPGEGGNIIVDICYQEYELDVSSEGINLEALFGPPESLPGGDGQSKGRTP